MKFTLYFFLAAGTLAAQPLIRDIIPHGAQRGQTVTLTLRGFELPAGARLETTIPGTVSRLTTPKDNPDLAPDSELPFLVQINKDAPTGVYPLRVATKDGISNLMLFAVGEYPEIEENEATNPIQKNNGAQSAETVTAPVVVNGTLTPADEDYFAFHAKAGQKLVFEVEARRAGSAIDPSIEITDAAGKPVAKNDDAPGISPDARVEVSFAKAGTYRVRVHDSRYSDQAQNFYRLKIGSYPYADAMFPLGWKRGEEVEVELTGGNLSAPVRVKTAAGSKGPVTPVTAPGSAALPMRFLLSDGAESLEPAGDDPHPLPEKTVVNGRIAKPGEKDRYRVQAQPGEHWVFEIQAASTGASQLDALLTAYDAKGKKIASRDDIAGADAALPLTVPADTGEVVLAVEDLLGRGGPGFAYRLEARRESADFTLDLQTPFVNVPAGGTAQVVVVAQRRGYNGTIRLRIPDLPAGYRVAGGHIPTEAAAQNFNEDNAGFRTARSVLTITAGEGAAPGPLELTIIGEAETPQGKLIREARGPGLITAVRGARQQAFTASWLGVKLPLALSKPLPVNLVTSTPLVRIAQGFEYVLDYRLVRRPGAPAVPRVNNQVAGAFGNLRINTGAARGPDAGNVLVNTNFATPVGTFDMLFDTTVDVGGRPFTIYSPAVAIEVVNGYHVDLAIKEVRLVPGTAATISGRVFREPTFEGSLVRVEAQDLPENVTCAKAEIPAGQSDFSFECQASSAAPPGAHEIRIASVAPETGRRTKDDYKIPDLTARLVIAGGSQAGR